MKELLERYRPQFNYENPVLRSVMEDLDHRPVKSSGMAQDLLRKTERRLGTLLPKSELLEATKMVQDSLYKRFGASNEHATIEYYASSGRILHLSKQVYHLSLGRFQKNDFSISGKIDALEEENGRMIVIEAKNRVHRLLRRIPLAENVQIQAYLQMTKLETGRLVQQYQDTLSVHQIERDDLFWDAVIYPKVQEFCQEFEKELDRNQ
ncbi:hypothetical protein EDD86DRAFT_255573 [Gorgonomyces haynaldii]|nr:hypothetical protein EDD86DRAFT_255573 [Gorgonomyces haynaldii]